MKSCTMLITLLSLTLIEGDCLILETLETAEALLRFLRDSATELANQPADTDQVLPEYDFIIVGAGSAGSVIANRLTEVNDWNILLIEAGGPENYLMDIPLIANFLQFTPLNWDYRTVPSEEVCLSMENRQCLNPRGRVLGGSSTINFMIYTRGNRKNYDQWQAMGNPGWGWDNVLPYFLKLENMTIPELAQNARYHSTSGEVTASYAPYRTVLANAFVEGGQELGFRAVDYNGETQIGFSYLQSTTRDGTRLSSSKAFLQPIRTRRNLHVKMRSFVTKIILDPLTNRTLGVQFVNNNRTYIVRARREVIISAGAINSPQLLLLSGVGPRDHLNEVGIRVIQDLKVGYNLMDQPGFSTGTFLINQSVSLVMDELLGRRRNLIDYAIRHTGPFSVPAGCEGIAFIDTKCPNCLDGDPDVELLFFAGGIPSEDTYYRNLGLSEEFYRRVYQPIQNRHSWSVVPLVLKPKSRGRVMLNSSNPYDKPLIHHNFFEDPADLELQISGIKIMLELSQTNSFQRFGSKFHDTPIPGCENFQFGSDDYWRCAAKHTSIPIYHLSGTCKMGPLTDPDAVVDSRLRVYGVKGLRVVDASIMPVVPTAHTNVPTMMIAEKAADMIKEDWRVRNTG